jgi:hypothetical protein
MNLKILLNFSILSLIMSTPVLANYSGKVLAKKIPPEVKYALSEIKTKTLVPIILPTVPKIGTLKQLIEIANSAIDNQP